jgi:predicted phosphoribosyltransferase
MRFTNREDAGRRLANHLASRPFDRPLVIALPRGGVPVAAEVATRLRAPLDVLVVRKLGHPQQPELGLGAITEGNLQILNQRLITKLGVTPEQLDGVTAIEVAALKRRVRSYRGDRPPISVRERTVILVDDGLATGFTARAAIEALRQQGARLIVLAVPVAPAATMQEMGGLVDQVICLRTPTFLGAIGHWYVDFGPVHDAEVARVLAEHATIPRGGAC